MALDRRSNTAYTTTPGRVAGRFVLLGVILTATGANARVVFFDEDTGSPSGTEKLDLRVAISGETKFFDFSSTPIRFESALNAGTVTNASVTAIFKEVGRN